MAEHNHLDLSRSGTFRTAEAWNAFQQRCEQEQITVRVSSVVRDACRLLLRHARFGYPRLDTELGRLATSASVRHSVWKRRVRSFSLADRVGVALERCPGLPSCWRPARTSRESGLWLALRRDPWNRDQ